MTRDKKNSYIDAVVMCESTLVVDVSSIAIKREEGKRHPPQQQPHLANHLKIASQRRCSTPYFIPLRTMVKKTPISKVSDPMLDFGIVVGNTCLSNQSKSATNTKGPRSKKASVSKKQSKHKRREKGKSELDNPKYASIVSKRDNGFVGKWECLHRILL